MKKNSPTQTSKDWPILRRLFHTTGQSAWRLVFPVVLSAAAVLFEGITIALLVPLLKGIIEKDYGFLYDNQSFAALAQWFHFSRETTPQKFLLAFLVVSIFLAAISKNILQYVSMVSIDKIVFHFTHRLRIKIFERITRMGKVYFDQVSMGALLNTISNSTMEIVMGVRGVHRHFSTTLLVLPYLFIMLKISWPLTLLGLMISPFFAHSVSGVVSRIREKSRIYNHLQMAFFSQASNVLMNIGLVKAFRTEELEGKKLESLSYESSQARFELEKRQEMVPAVHEMSTLLALLIMMSAMAFMVYYQIHQDVSQLLVFFFTLKRSLNSFGAISHLKATVSKMSGPLMEVDDILFHKEDMFEREGEDKEVFLTKHIVFKDVSFSYHNGAMALKEVNLVFDKGKCTALVGASGSGKTSVVSLLLGLYSPQKGKIVIDDKDIRGLTLDALRGCFALVSQETFLFNDSIRNNLLYGTKQNVTEDELLQTVRKARLEDLLELLPEGLNTVIGDRGVKLSGGEKQRLAIARAILRKSPVLIFDEATSALDSTTERKVQEAIEEASLGRTTIVIAHRLSTIRNADKIIVLEKGQVAEQGTFQKLIDEKRRFYNYWTEQSSSVS